MPGLDINTGIWILLLIISALIVFWVDLWWNLSFCLHGGIDAKLKKENDIWLKYYAFENNTSSSILSKLLKIIENNTFFE